jgi:predicted MPP superfamily phosphohydrolase
VVSDQEFFGVLPRYSIYNNRHSKEIEVSEINRRGFLKALGQVIVGSGVTLGVGYVYGTQVEPERLTIERVQVPLKNLKPALEGFKIVQLSDLHLYPFTQLELIQEAVTQANSLKPDLIALTGDYVLEDAETIFELAPVLAALNARYGVFAILGNHDLWTNAATVYTGLEQAGLPVLINKGLSLNIGQATINLAGVDDGWSGAPDLKAALDNLPPDATTLLLAHEPDLADIFAEDGRVSLQLSGHSHGGQVRLPGVGALVLPYLGRKYDHGLNQVGDLWVYTNRGIGVINPPIRLNCPPEITEVTLIRQ